jgi:DNA-binding MarR family transcriptional regulator
MNALIFEIFRVHGRLLQHGDRIAAPHGLTSARWQVLGALRDGPRTVPQMGRVMGVSRQAMQRTVNMLAVEGLVASSPNPDHRASPLFHLTAAGRQRLEAVNADQSAWLGRIAQRGSLAADAIPLREKIAAFGELFDETSSEAKQNT